MYRYFRMGPGAWPLLCGRERWSQQANAPPPPLAYGFCGQVPQMAVDWRVPLPFVGLGVLGSKEKHLRGCGAWTPRQPPPLPFCAGLWFSAGATGRKAIGAGPRCSALSPHVPAPLRDREAPVVIFGPLTSHHFLSHVLSRPRERLTQGRCR